MTIAITSQFTITLSDDNIFYHELKHETDDVNNVETIILDLFKKHLQDKNILMLKNENQVNADESSVLVVINDDIHMHYSESIYDYIDIDKYIDGQLSIRSCEDLNSYLNAQKNADLIKKINSSIKNIKLICDLKTGNVSAGNFVLDLKYNVYCLGQEIIKYIDSLDKPTVNMHLMLETDKNIYHKTLDCQQFKDLCKINSETVEYQLKTYATIFPTEEFFNFFANTGFNKENFKK